MRKWLVAGSAAVIVAGAMVVSPWRAPAARANGGTTAFFLDFNDGFQTVTQSMTPDISAFGSDWNGLELRFYVQPFDDSNDYTIGFFAEPGSGLDVGTYEGNGIVRVNGSESTSCADQFTITAISPVPQAGIPLTIDVLDASFSHVCGTESWQGEVRYNASTAFSAIGMEDVPIDARFVVLTGNTFIGRASQEGTITLVNRGTQSLTFGDRSIVNDPDFTWTFATDTCSDATLAPGATCEISGAARSWARTSSEARLNLPVSTARGFVTIPLQAEVRGGLFVPIDPVRLVDSRIGKGLSSVLTSKVAQSFPVVNVDPGDPSINIPAEAMAVAGNLTVTGHTSSGYVALTTLPTNVPPTSTLNAPKGDTRANGTIVRLSDTGSLGVTWVGSPGSTAHVLFDATGYWIMEGGEGGTFALGSPKRVLDSRTGVGFSGALQPHEPKTFTLTGIIDGAAVAGNLTAISPTAAGYLLISPVAQPDPDTSTLNVPSGDNRANNAVVRVGSGQTLSVTWVGPPGSSTHVAFDWTGTFGAGNYVYVPLVPSRVTDSRKTIGLAPHVPAQTPKIATIDNRYPNDPSRNLPVDLINNNLQAVTGNVTFVTPTKSGFLTIRPPSDGAPPTTSTINSPAGDIRANGFVVGDNGSGVGVWYGAKYPGTTEVVIDATGYFTR